MGRSSCRARNDPNASGGELPALIIIDTMARHVPGVLGNFDSREEARNASNAVYTRPEVLEYKGKKYKVPPVLMSGDHKKIEAWRASESAVSKKETDTSK